MAPGNLATISAFAAYDYNKFYPPQTQGNVVDMAVVCRFSVFTATATVASQLPAWLTLFFILFFFAEYFQQYESDQFDEENMTFEQLTAASASELSFDPTESNLNRLLKSNAQVEQYSVEEMCRKDLGDVVVFDTTLLQEFSVKSDSCDVKQMTGHDSGENESDDGVAHQQRQQSHTFDPTQFEEIAEQQTYPTPQTVSSQSPPQCNEFSKQEASLISNKPMASIPQQQQQQEPLIQKKVHVPINEWKSSQCKSPKQSVPSSDDDALHHNSSFEVEDEEDELDEELERLRLDQERSFKAKLYAFENLAKQEEEAARKAAESYRRRQQSRQAKLAAERSKSLGNIQQSSNFSSSHQKTPVSTSHSVSSSSIPAPHQVASFSPESPVSVSAPSKTQLESQSKSMQNLNSNSISSDYSLSTNSTNSTVYNFTEKAQRPASQDVEAPATVQTVESKVSTPSAASVQSQKQQTLANQVVDFSSNKHLSQSVPTSQQQQQQAQNIYENITPLSFSQVKHQPTQAATPVAAAQPQPQQLPVDPVTDSNAIRNASQKLLQQQQQIYQNQPLPYQSQQQQQHYPLESYSNVPPNFGNYPQYDLTGSQQSHLIQQQQHPASLDHPIQPTDSILNDMVINPVPIRGYPIVDDVGLPPIQITKSIQSGSSKPYNAMSSIPVAANKQQEEEHLYVNQNQLMLNPSGKTHNSVYPYDFHPNSATYEKYVYIYFIKYILMNFLYYPLATIPRYTILSQTTKIKRWFRSERTTLLMETQFIMNSFNNLSKFTSTQTLPISICTIRNRIQHLTRQWSPLPSSNCNNSSSSKCHKCLQPFQ